MIYQDFSELVYDSGNYEPALDRAAEMIGWTEFKQEKQPRARAAGKSLGIGLVSYVEGTGIGPYEGARVDGRADRHGQRGDRHRHPGPGPLHGLRPGGGRAAGHRPGPRSPWSPATPKSSTGAPAPSPAAARWSPATLATPPRSRCARRSSRWRPRSWRRPRPTSSWSDGKVQVRGVPAKSLDLGQLARQANPMRGAVVPGTEPGLEATCYFGPAYGTTASGVHAMVVELDRETFDVKILKYVVVHDCGTVINPLVLEGQIVGGVAQGIGNAFYEKIVYDRDGQLLSGSFADYLLPTACEVPRVETDHVVTPSPLNPLGIKGAGEAGAIPVGALFAQAVEDALGADGLEILEIHSRRTASSSCSASWLASPGGRPMKPAAFAYEAPADLGEVLELLAEGGDDAKLLAGGQSLVPAMNFRLARPSLLIDLNGVADLAYLHEEEGELRIGAMTRQRQVERSPLVAQAAAAGARNHAVDRPSADPQPRHFRRQPGARRPGGRAAGGGAGARRPFPPQKPQRRTLGGGRGLFPGPFRDRPPARRDPARGGDSGAEAG